MADPTRTPGDWPVNIARHEYDEVCWTDYCGFLDPDKNDWCGQHELHPVHMLSDAPTGGGE